MRVSDSRGTLRGLAFGADRDGTLLTAHEVVDGLAAVRLLYHDGRSVRVGAGAIVPLPELGLALLRSEVAPGAPWPLADGAGTRLVSVSGHDAALQGAVAGLVTARYEAADRFFPLSDVWQLSLEQAPSGLPVHAAGGPVVDAETGAAVGVATAALRSRRRGAVLAVRLGAVAGEPVLADLLTRNAETVPAHGRALNLAGVLELTAAGIDAAATKAVARRVPRADGLIEAVQGWDPVRPVLAVVGEAGSGRTTELAALTLHRTRAAYRLPTLWLRGADLGAGDASVFDAADRVLGRVHRLRHPGAVPLAGRAAKVAAAAHRPLLIVLDAPEEAPPQLLARWRGWCAETVRRLRGTDCRLLLGCLPEFWERTGGALGPDDVHGSHLLGPLDRQAAAELALRQDSATGRTATEPGAAGLVTAGDGLALSLLGEVRAAQPALALPRSRPLSRTDMLSARLDLACLRIAERIPAPPTQATPPTPPTVVPPGTGPQPATTGDASRGPGFRRRRPASREDAPRALPQAGPERGPAPARVPAPAPARIRPLVAAGHERAGSSAVPDAFTLSDASPHAVRRRAALVAGRCHEAARRMLGAPDGGLTAQQFDELFPWAEGWAQAALGEGVFVAAGAGYRFASGALADWLQGFHLDVPAALTMVLADASPPAVEESPPRPVGAHRRGGPLGWAPPVPVPGQPPGGGVPRWRLAVVRQALLGLHAGDPQALEALLSRLVLRLDGPEAAPPGSEAHWWAERLLTGTLERLPDAVGYVPLLRAVAARIVHDHHTGPTNTARPWSGDERAADDPAAGSPYREARTGTAEASDMGGSATGVWATGVWATGVWAAGVPSATVPFLPWDFWRRLPLTVEARLDVLRVLVRARAEEPERLLGEVLVQDPEAALPRLCHWLADEHLSGTAAETLFAHRHVALDQLAEALVDAAHPRADALLRALAQAEPSALGRAVDRWAHDPRPERHVAAATLLPLLARQAAGATSAERTLVRLAAEALLARGDEEALHGAAYTALVSDPLVRGRHLDGAVARYLDGDPLLGAAALAPALDSDPALVLRGFAGRLREPGEEAAAVLRALGTTPAPRARAAAARLVREHLQRRPEAAGQVGGWLRARLAHGPAEHGILLAFVRDAAAEQPEPVRRRLAEALADVDIHLARQLRGLLCPAVTSPMRIQDRAHGKV